MLHYDKVREMLLKNGWEPETVNRFRKGKSKATITPKTYNPPFEVTLEKEGLDTMAWIFRADIDDDHADFFIDQIRFAQIEKDIPEGLSVKSCRDRLLGLFSQEGWSLDNPIQLTKGDDSAVIKTDSEGIVAVEIQKGNGDIQGWFINLSMGTYSYEEQIQDIAEEVRS